MSQYRTLTQRAGIASLTLKEIPGIGLMSGEVRVTLKAWFLNGRDLILARGVLSQLRDLDARALVPLPDNICFEQAACLPCVAVTAWNALFEVLGLKPGQIDVATGT